MTGKAFYFPANLCTFRLPISVLLLCQKQVYDPHVKQEQVKFPLVSFLEAISDAECILVLADHNEFKQLDEQSIIQQMKSAIIFDTKNCVNLIDKSITYYNYSNLFEMRFNNQKVLL